MASSRLDGILLGSAADVAGAVVVVIGWYARNLAVPLHARRPVALIAAEIAVALPAVERLPRALRQLRRRLVERGHGRRGRQRLAEIGGHVARIIARIQRRHHAPAIRPNPHPHVEGDALGRLLEGFRAARRDRRSPRQLLRREALHAGVRQNAGQRRREAEAIRQHVFRAGLAEFLAEPVIAVEHLADDALGVGRVDIALFHRGAGRKPVPGFHVLLQLLEIGRVVFLEEPVPVGAGEVEHVVRVLFEQAEVPQQGIFQVFVDHLRILPAPLGIEVRVAHYVERRLSGQVRRGTALSVGNGGDGQTGRYGKRETVHWKQHRRFIIPPAGAEVERPRRRPRPPRRTVSASVGPSIGSAARRRPRDYPPNASRPPTTARPWRHSPRWIRGRPGFAGGV